MGGETWPFKYHMGMHLAICHEPDAVTEIVAGDRSAWKPAAAVEENEQIHIDEPELFGGNLKEGGIVGDVDIMFGRQGQLTNDYLTTKQGSPQPGYRGILSLVLRQVFLSAGSQYIKPWAIRVRHLHKGWQPALADITTPSGLTGQANAAHIIRACLTNSVWGMGYPESSVDDASFAQAAQRLFDEGFGISLIWNQQATIEEFIQEVLNHIGGMVRTDPVTGKFTLFLIRDDFDPNMLPIYCEQNILELTQFERVSWGDLINEVTVNYTNPETEQNLSLTVTNPASVQIQGAIVAQTTSYAGIRDSGLAARVAMRDLSASSTPLAAIKIKTNRKAWNMLPGDLFRFSWASLGIDGLVCRAMAIDEGTLEDGAISISAVEEAFGLPDDAYLVPVETSWEDPLASSGADDNTYARRSFELPYYECVRMQREALPPGSAISIDPAQHFVGGLEAIKEPSRFDEVPWIDTTKTIALQTKALAETTYVTRDTRPQLYKDLFLELTESIGLGVQTTAHATVVDNGLTPDVPWDDPFDPFDPTTPSTEWALLGDEIVQVVSSNGADNTVTIRRGLLDTVPQPHNTGAEIVICGLPILRDPTARAIGTTVNLQSYKTWNTGSGTAITAAMLDVVITGRQAMPYPPGNLRLNGDSYPATISGMLTVSWAHRNRLTQSDGAIVLQSAADITPEAGTQYVLELYGETGALMRTETTSGNSYIWASEIVDSGLGRLNNQVRIVLKSTRGGLSSWQEHDVTVTRV